MVVTFWSLVDLLSLRSVINTHSLYLGKWLDSQARSQLDVWPNHNYIFLNLRDPATPNMDITWFARLLLSLNIPYPIPSRMPIQGHQHAHLSSPHHCRCGLWSCDTAVAQSSKPITSCQLHRRLPPPASHGRPHRPLSHLCCTTCLGHAPPPSATRPLWAPTRALRVKSKGKTMTQWWVGSTCHYLCRQENRVEVLVVRWWKSTNSDLPSYKDSLAYIGCSLLEMLWSGSLSGTHYRFKIFVKKPIIQTCNFQPQNKTSYTEFF